MPRRLREIIPGQPHHVIQRGINRMPTFLDAEDFDRCYRVFVSVSGYYRCSVHCYGIMSNHVHLIVTPADEFGLPKCMQAFASSYARYYNKKYARTGGLWDGRYKSFIIGSERYFFDCSRYIEMNPVSASMVDNPGDYIRSSFRCNALGATDPLVTPHPLYRSLGKSAEERRAAYQDLFKHHLDPRVCDAIRRSTHTGETLGKEREFEGEPPHT